MSRNAVRFAAIHTRAKPAPALCIRSLDGPLFESDRGKVCTAKRRFIDEKSVRTYMNRFALRRGNHGRPEMLSAYSCPFCGGFHLTKS